MANSYKSKKIKLALFIVDAFTKQPFKGNSAAVCLIPYHQSIPSDVKQNIASEMNLSETAFIKILKEGDTFENSKRFALQWYTPTCEVGLCGHGTVASAAVLFSVCNNHSETLEFETTCGILTAKKLRNGNIQINLPAYESKTLVIEEYEDIIKAAVGSLPVQEILLSDSKNLIIHLHDDVTRAQLEQLKPRDSELLAAMSDIIGVAVTLKGLCKDDCLDSDWNSYDFMSRYFAPWFGVSEDPVCGSVHCALGPYWAKVLQKNVLSARQCSSRGGDLLLKVVYDRTLINGDAVIVVEGQINL
ncbi:Phenazine biosynthesis-like domain-containing protein 1, partial [Stegodyphus mimosarum]